MAAKNAMNKISNFFIGLRVLIESLLVDSSNVAAADELHFTELNRNQAM